jgi:hypothetical protein
MFSVLLFGLILILTLILLFTFLYALSDFNSKLFLVVFTFFYYIYNGVGLAYSEVSNILRLAYLIFYIIFCLTFIYFYRIKIRQYYIIRKSFDYPRIGSEKQIKFFAYLFILLNFISLIYPNFIVSRLIHPPTPDLLGNLNDFQQSNAPNILLSKILFYIQTLCFPFIFLYFDVFKVNNKIKTFLILTTVLNYVSYVQSAYISRSDILMYIQISFLVYFLTKQKFSLNTIKKIAIPIFLIVFFLSAYQEIRLGNNTEISSGVTLVLKKAFETEVSFPKDVMQKIIDKKLTTSFPNYVGWLSTLPVPKFLIPKLIVFELNKNISETLLGIPTDDQYFFILLPGILGESIYIYSIYFYMFHAIFIGFLFALILRLFKNNHKYYFYQSYLIVLMTYYTSRGGIVSSLPLIINGNILVLFFFYYLNKFSIKKNKVGETYI